MRRTILMILSFTILAYSQVVYKDEFILSDYTFFSQETVDIESDANGNYVATWASYEEPPDTSLFTIVAQRFNTYGDAVGSRIKVNTTLVGSQINPKIAVNKDGSFVIVWQSWAQEGADSLGYGIYGQRFDANGNKLGSEFHVNTFESDFQISPDVSSDSLGNFVVVWESNGENVDSYYQVYYRTYNSSGVPTDTVRRADTNINTSNITRVRAPEVAMNPDGTFVIVWSTWQLDDPGFGGGVYAQRFSKSGAKVGSEFIVNTNILYSQKAPDIDSDDNGDFIVVWETQYEFNGFGVAGQLFDSTATKIGTEFLVNTFTDSDQELAAVSMDKTGNFVVTWQSNTQDGSGYGVFAQRYDNTGAKISNEFQVNDYTFSNQGYPSVAVADRGDFFIAWQSYEQDLSLNGVYGKIYKMAPYYSGFDLEISEDSSLKIPITDLYPYVSDESNLDSELSWQFVSGSNITVTFNNDSLLVLPAENFYGQDSFKVIVTDPTALTDTAYQVVTVNPVNDSPVVSNIPDQTVDEGNPFLTINLDDYVTDIDNSDSEISWQAGGQNELNVSINIDRIVTISAPDSNWFGSEKILFTAIDPGALFDTTSVMFTINSVNDAPVVTDIPGQTIAEGSTFTTINLDSYVNDVDNTDAELNWSYSGNSELTVSIVNRVATISVPDVNWFGAETITFTVTDPGELSDSDGAAFTVTNVDDPPVVSDIPDQTITEGQSFTSINLDDYVNDVDNTDAEITWNYSGNTDLSVNINPVNRVAVVTIPNSNWAGNETITFTATDQGGMFDSDAATFTVTNVNDAPVVADIPNQTIAEGGTFTTIALDDYVSDVDNPDNEITWGVTGNDLLGVSIVNRIVTITIPDAEWSGSETLTFTATDPGELSDSDPATFTVTAVNDAPVVTDIPNQTIVEGSNFTTINLDDYVSDIDNTDAQMNWIYSGNSELAVSINNRIATISIPSAEWNGSEVITFTASDPGGLSDNDNATFTVTAVNDAPVVSDIPNQSIAEGGTFTTISLDDYVSDVDNPDTQIIWTYSGNTELIVNIDVNRIATISTPDANWNGNETITFTATDPGELSDNDAATFTVSADNDPPVVSGIPDQTILEGESFTTINLDDYVSDLDNTDAEMVWTYSGQNELTVNIVNRVATIGIPDANWNGSETITFTATDPGNLSNSDAAVFTVNASNDAPVVADIPSQVINEGSSFATINLDSYVSDLDNTDSQMTWTYSGNNQLTVSIDENRVASIIIPNTDWNGKETITFTAKDPGGLSDSDTASFTVIAENDAPVVSDIPDQDIAEGADFATINLDDYVSDVDNPDSEISWIASETTDLSVVIDENRVARITVPNADWSGVETITFTATDPGDLSDSDQASFTVTAVNDIPVISEIPDQTIDEGNSFASINLDNYVEDVDNTDSEMSWSFSGNIDLQVNIDTNRVASIKTPSADWNGSEAIIFSVADPGEMSAADTVIFTVIAVNDAPVLLAVPALTFKEDEKLSQSQTAWYEFVNDPDNADSTLTYIVSGGKNVTYQHTNGNFVFSSPLNWFGNDTLELKISDGELADSVNFVVNVTAVNDAPQLVDFPKAISMDDTSTYVINLNDYVEDVDSPKSGLVWGFSADNDSLILDYDQENALLSISALPFAGDVHVAITVADDASATTDDTITVTISLVTALNEIVGIIPDKYSISQNYPNPFNPTTQIKYGLPKAGKVRVEIFNIIGQKVATLVNENKPAGFHLISFDASGLSSGMYFYRIQAAKFNQVRKMILMK
ncbi:MAG: tandem-95 repeat protein [Calditrichae bacterium]|nr:tandem-95 repeat protein [Calditrichia bacterium]